MVLIGCGLVYGFTAREVIYTGSSFYFLHFSLSSICWITGLVVLKQSELGLVAWWIGQEIWWIGQGVKGISLIGPWYETRWVGLKRILIKLHNNTMMSLLSSSESSLGCR